MSFDNLNAEGYASLILAIVFSIITIASIIFFLRHKKPGITISILSGLVFPIITVFCWFYLIMTVCGYSLANCLYIALGTSAIYTVTVLGIGIVVNYFKKAKKTKNNTNVTKKPKSADVVVTPLLVHSDEQTKLEEEIKQLEEKLKQLNIEKQKKPKEVKQVKERKIESIKQLPQYEKPVEKETVKESIPETEEEPKFDEDLLANLLIAKEPESIENHVEEKTEEIIEQSNTETTEEIQPKERLIEEEVQQVEGEKEETTIAENVAEEPEETKEVIEDNTSVDEVSNELAEEPTADVSPVEDDIAEDKIQPEESEISEPKTVKTITEVTEEAKSTPIVEEPEKPEPKQDDDEIIIDGLSEIRDDVVVPDSIYDMLFGNKDIETITPDNTEKKEDE